MRCAPLPSGESACALVNGQPGAAGQVAAHAAARAAIIAAGLLLFGAREPVRSAVVASLTIEVFAIGWARYTQEPL